MRILVVLAIIVMLVEPTFAQVKPTFQFGGEKKDPAVEQYRKQKDEEYKAALDKIPDQKKKSNDPWENVRGADPARKK